ncbi:MAG TPA: glucokinase [Planctomycetaceae bacterium]|nr:glucokinase [Planctomycetaceae bacterium]
MLKEKPLVMITEAVAPFFLGIDVGGTSIKIGVVDDYGRIVDIGEKDESGAPRGFRPVKTEPAPLTATQQMAKVIQDLMGKLKLQKDDIKGIGLGIPGTMDMETRRLRQPPNLHSWEGYAMCDELAKITGYPVTFCNDANAAAYGEYWVGSASGKRSIALLTLGTGIGTGIIIEGRSIDGATGYGGECGHLLIDISENARLCGCGQRGHLEAYCSATAVARRTIALTDIHPSSLREQITPETRLGEIPKLVCEEAELGDPLALQIVGDTARFLAMGIVSILNTVDPACVLIGGAMTFGGNETALGQRFLDQIRREVVSRSFKAIGEHVHIDYAVLGGDAGFIGSAGLAREEYLKQASA